MGNLQYFVGYTPNVDKIDTNQVLGESKVHVTKKKYNDDAIKRVLFTRNAGQDFDATTGYCGNIENGVFVESKNCRACAIAKHEKEDQERLKNATRIDLLDGRIIVSDYIGVIHYEDVSGKIIDYPPWRTEYLVFHKMLR